jgi:hypothetical protein
MICPFLRIPNGQGVFGASALSSAIAASLEYGLVEPDGSNPFNWFDEDDFED